MNEESVVYKGDIIIINDKDNISTAEYRSVLEVGVPYFVDGVGFTGSIYIKVFGKEITIYESDWKYIEHIEVDERKVFKVGDYVMIKDDEKVAGALELGFREGLSFEVVKAIESNGIVIKNGDVELWIKKSEIQFLKSIDNQNSEEAEKVVIEIENINIQYLIDKALDERDFEALKRLTNEKSKFKQLT